MNFKLFTPLLFLIFTVSSQAQQTCEYQEGSFENWTEFVDSSFVEYGFDPLFITFPNFHASAFRVFVIAFSGFTFPEGSQEHYDFVSSGYGITKSNDSYDGDFSAKVSGDAMIPYADLYSVHPCNEDTDKLTFYLKHIGNSPDTLDLYFFRDTSVTSFPANESQLLDYPSYIEHRIIKSGTDTSFTKIEIPFTKNFESILADTIFGNFIVSGNHQFFINGGQSYFLIDNVKFEKNGIDNDGDGFNADVDCDDNNAAINADAVEIPNNNIDENCDGIILIIDEDGDGFNSDLDCDDNNAAINSSAVEIPNNNIDENCDGIVLIIDVDGDGFNSDVDCNDNNGAINPNAIEIANNNVDENCDGVILVIDEDGDGFNSDVDCDDNNSGINPNGIEIPNNGIDEDCNGADLISSTSNLNNLSFSIHPNPTNKFINIITGEDLDNIQIINQVGQTLLMIDGKNKENLDLEYLQSGIYFIKITAKNNISAHKIFIKK